MDVTKEDVLQVLNNLSDEREMDFDELRSKVPGLSFGATVIILKHLSTEGLVHGVLSRNVFRYSKRNTLKHKHI